MALNIVLFEPEIPHNTGNIARTCALTGTRLHLIRPLGFSTDDKHLKRAGLDYWNLVEIYYYDSNDFFIFGKETKGLPSEIVENNLETCIKIPMREDLKRSLNLANSANIILFEALRQLDFSVI